MKKWRRETLPKYLKPWASNDTVYCLKKGHICSASLSALETEEWFHDAATLKPDDIPLIENAVASLLPNVHLANCKDVLAVLLIASEAKRLLNGMPLEDWPELGETLWNFEHDYERTTDEWLQYATAAMLAGETDLCSNQDDLWNFLFSLCVRYLRTKTARQILESRISRSVNRSDLGSVCCALRHIVVRPLAQVLLLAVKHHKIQLLQNSTPVSFVTSDRPVINLFPLSKDLRRATLDEVMLYYPLSPERAMLLMNVDFPDVSMQRLVRPQDVRRYNVAIAKESCQQLFSNSVQALEQVRGWSNTPP